MIQEKKKESPIKIKKKQNKEKEMQAYVKIKEKISSEFKEFMRIHSNMSMGQLIKKR